MINFDSDVRVAYTLVPVSFDKIGISLVSKKTFVGQAER